MGGGGEKRKREVKGGGREKVIRTITSILLVRSKQWKDFEAITLYYKLGKF